MTTPPPAYEADHHDERTPAQAPPINPAVSSAAPSTSAEPASARPDADIQKLDTISTDSPGIDTVKGQSGNDMGDREESARLREAVSTQLHHRLGHSVSPATPPTSADESSEEKLSSSGLHTKPLPSDSIHASHLPSYGSKSASRSSTQTIKGDATPRSAAPGAKTPSYPFPPMDSPRPPSHRVHRPFTTLSPTVAPEMGTPRTQLPTRYGVPADDMTPTAKIPFLPSRSSEDTRLPGLFPSPNLYDATLKLNSEPGLDAWWDNVVTLCRESFRAERVTLSIPADTTDPENVPWGQKATFDASIPEEGSMAYLRRSSFDYASDDAERADLQRGSFSPLDDVTSTPRDRGSRPTPVSRYSFSEYERRAESVRAPQNTSFTQRPAIKRAESYVPTLTSLSSSGDTVQQQQVQETQKHGMARDSSGALNLETIQGLGQHDSQSRVLPVLQALDYEAEPLIDSAGVTRVLEKGKIVTLSRQYTAPGQSDMIQQSSQQEPQADVASRHRPWPQSEVSEFGFLEEQQRPPTSTATASRLGPQLTRRTSRRPPLASADENAPERSFQGPPLGEHIRAEISGSQYEEFEQFPPSPWSQSPAPSPAVIVESAENPFFAAAKVDEESFNPTLSPQDYSSAHQVEAIGLDYATTIIHVPLIHPLLSRHVPNAPVDSTPLEKTRQQGASPDNPRAGEHVENADGGKVLPIAIISILSQVIPYPSNLLHSLSLLGPHLATSFSLSRHYTNAATEAAGLLRRRGQQPTYATSSHSGLGHGQSLEDLVHLDVPQTSNAENWPTVSLDGSVTSPSDRSVISRGSTGNSLAGTPGIEYNNLISGDRSGPNTPARHMESDTLDGYFQSGSRQFPRSSGATASQHPVTPGQQEYPRQLSTEQSLIEDGRSKQWQGSERSIYTRTTGPDAHPGMAEQTIHHGFDPLSATSSTFQSSDKPTESVRDTAQRQRSNSRQQGERLTPQRRPAMAYALNPPSQRPHSLLHSYGADFNATFQTLPTAATSVSRGQSANRLHSRHTSDPSSVTFDMPPPSERLLRTIIDSIPVQIFTAAPQSGSITWVNSRFLTYRGLSVADFVKEPWQNIHPDERKDYLKAWKLSLRNGQQFSYQVRVKRFDGVYRWFYVRAAPLRDTRGVTVHWFGTNMDVHDQYIAEINAARQEETAASEQKYRSLANSSPQIVFAATDSHGITFANTQWLAYSGQKLEDTLGMGFMEHVHPDDLPKCRLPEFKSPVDPQVKSSKLGTTQSETASAVTSPSKSGRKSKSTEEDLAGEKSPQSTEDTLKETQPGSPASERFEPKADGSTHVSSDAEGKLSYSTELRLKSKDGSYRWHLVRCITVDAINFGNGDGSWFGTCTDINDHKLLEQRMKETMDSKTRFLSNMSHEIRTPLIGISGMVEFLADTPLTAEQTDYCNTIRTSSEGLLTIVNDILDLSKIEAGMMALSQSWFYIRSMMESVNDAVSSVAINKGLELNYVVEEDVPVMVKGDQARIRQILMNVLGNAVKFTATGEVFAHCQLYRREVDDETTLAEDEVELLFEVIDSGPGFSQKESELIFKPFIQIDGSSTRQYGGSGLGLVISRQLVELHGGELTGVGAPGEGSTFTFHAKFTVPTDTNNPNPTKRRDSSGSTSAPSATTTKATRSIDPTYTNRPLIAPVLHQSPSPVVWTAENMTPSSGSSDPSIRSVNLHTPASERSSMSSVAPPISAGQFPSSHDATKINLVLPEAEEDQATPSPATSITPTPSSMLAMSAAGSALLHPTIYSILIVCHEPYSLRAVTKHVEMTLPKDVPHKVTGRRTVSECQALIGGDEPVVFTHIVLNLGKAEEAVTVIGQLSQSPAHAQTTIIILTDTKMRTEIRGQAAALGVSHLEREKRVMYLHKPIKPSRFAAVFDPAKERESSRDRNRSSAERLVGRRKQVFADMEKNVGNKGFKVLLVEDNPVNQKVLLKFLQKVGMEVETAVDGKICTEKVFSKDHDYYSIILCDLHMPNKDGYQTCKEIRAWEEKQAYPYMPIIALSANVMADVLERCTAAGFSNYVAKPVDFKSLSKAMTDLLEPADPASPHILMRHARNRAHAPPPSPSPSYNL